MRQLFAAVCLAVCLVGCGSESETSADRSTDTRSTEFSTQGDKVDFLDDYLTLASDVQATEFHIWFQDNAAGRVPGPSDWSFVVALRIDPGDVPAWTADRTAVDVGSIDLMRWDELDLDADPWRRSSTPSAYEGSGSQLVVYEPEGIVLLSSATA